MRELNDSVLDLDPPPPIDGAFVGRKPSSESFTTRISDSGVLLGQKGGGGGGKRGSLSVHDG